MKVFRSTLTVAASATAIATVAASLLLANSAHAANITTFNQANMLAGGQYYANDIGRVILSRNDDGSTSALNLGFSLPFYGGNYAQYYINNNGNISFNNGISQYVPTGPLGVAQPVISLFFADVDTRGARSGEVHLNDATPGQVIVTWNQVGYYQRHDDLLASFQLVLRSPTFSVPAGEGQIGFFYRDMPWMATNTSTAAATGFGNGQGDGTIYENSPRADLNTLLANRYIWFNVNSAGTPVVTPTPGGSGGGSSGGSGSVPISNSLALAMMGLMMLGLARRQ